MAKSSKTDVKRPAPSVAKWRLAGMLRAAREANELTIEAACDLVHVTASTLMRFEKGATAPGYNDLEAIMREYGVEPAVADRMRATGEDARRRSPLAKYVSHRHVDAQWLRYLEFEWSAESIRNFEPLLIPGLLQTPEYSHAVVSLVERHEKEKVETLLGIRRMRQDLTQARAKEGFPLGQHFIFDEAAIRRQVGGSTVMRQQLTHLIDRMSNDSDEVRIQVVPFDRGLYAHLRVGYVLLKLLATDDGQESEPPVLYLEEALEQLVIHEERGNKGKSGRRDRIDLDQSLLEVIAAEQKPAEYSTVFDTVAQTYAAGPEETISLLEAARSQMGG